MLQHEKEGKSKAFFIGGIRIICALSQIIRIYRPLFAYRRVPSAYDNGFSDGFIVICFQYEKIDAVFVHSVPVDDIRSGLLICISQAAYRPARRRNNRKVYHAGNSNPIIGPDVFAAGILNAA